MKTLALLLLTSLLIPAHVMADDDPCAEKYGDRRNQELAGVQQEAKEYREALEKLRAEKDIKAKLTAYLKQLSDVQEVEKMHPGNRPVQYHVRYTRNPILHVEKLEKKYTRLLKALGDANKRLAKNELRQDQLGDLEFSVNGLIEVSIRSLKGIESKIDDDKTYTAEALKHCEKVRREGGSPGEVREARHRTGWTLTSFKLAFRDIVLSDYEILPNGKYNMSLTRIEGLNRSRGRSADSPAVTGSAPDDAPVAPAN